MSNAGADDTDDHLNGSVAKGANIGPVNIPARQLSCLPLSEGGVRNVDSSEQDCTLCFSLLPSLPACFNPRPCCPGGGGGKGGGRKKVAR